MAVVQDKSGNNPVDQRLSTVNRTAANIAAIMLLTPEYSGELIRALDTGRRYCGVGLTVGAWGAIGKIRDGAVPHPGNDLLLRDGVSIVLLRDSVSSLQLGH